MADQGLGLVGNMLRFGWLLLVGLLTLGFMPTHAANTLRSEVPNSENVKIHIIPQPVSVVRGQGMFLVNSQTRITYSTTNPELGKIATQFTNRFGKATGIMLRHNGPGLIGRQINLSILSLSESKGTSQTKADQTEPGTNGAYFVDVSPTEIRITATQPAGLFYGLQTLWQLFPHDIDKNSHTKQDWSVPSVRIMDSPRFGWRGMHLDVSRHFFTVAEVKQYLNYLATYKFNVFHWHLTDDQGWRIEIKQYPKLVSHGSKRHESMLGHTRHQPYRYDGTPHEGHYTHQDIQDIVSYAADRYITVVPEIEMPGHAQAAIAAYPELGCLDTPSVMRKWGISPYIFNVKEPTFQFIERTLDEVLALFPGKYIHIGGDEAIKQQWKRSSEIQNQIKQLGLRNEHELQSYFIKRIERYLNTKGRILIGWDEILQGGLAPNAAVMSWRGIDGGRKAAQAGHPVVMSPMSHCYLDFYQHDKVSEPLCIGRLTTLRKVYSFEPAPSEFGPRAQQMILGLQGNVWTEYLPNFGRVQQQIFPRMLALSEIGWTTRSNLSWTTFLTRVKTTAQRLDYQNIGHGHIPHK